MELSIIIVNWNSVDYLRRCLESIYRETTDLEFEVVVVDNASFDGSEELVKAKFPEVRLIQSAENIGFAGANNLGFQHSSGKTILFLNPDTEVWSSAINVLFTSLHSMPDAGAVGGKLLNSDGTLQISCVQSFPTILNQMLDFEWLQVRFPRLKIWGIKPLFVDRGVPEEVDVVSGACLMVKRSVFEKAGLFSKDYFMYSEDVELCYKIRQSGWRVYYVGKAEIVHYGGASAKEHPIDALEDVLTREARYQFMAKTRGTRYARLYKFSVVPVSLVRLFCTVVLSSLALLSKSKNEFAHSRKKWTKILRWSIGMEGWTQAMRRDGQSSVR